MTSANEHAPLTAEQIALNVCREVVNTDNWQMMERFTGEVYCSRCQRRMSSGHADGCIVVVAQQVIAAYALATPQPTPAPTPDASVVAAIIAALEAERDMTKRINDKHGDAWSRGYIAGLTSAINQAREIGGVS